LQPKNQEPIDQPLPEFSTEFAIMASLLYHHSSTCFYQVTVINKRLIMHSGEVNLS